MVPGEQVPLEEGELRDVVVDVTLDWLQDRFGDGVGRENAIAFLWHLDTHCAHELHVIVEGQEVLAGRTISVRSVPEE